MHELQDLGEDLVQLDARHFAELAAALELPERLVEAIREAHAITSWGARKRQLQYIGKLMRDIDAEPIRQRLDARAHGRDEQTMRAHAVERLRESLLAEPDALDRLALAHPALDRARIATLIAQARIERAEGRAPHAYRELFRQLKSLDSR